LKTYFLLTILLLSQPIFSQSTASYNTNINKYDAHANIVQIIGKTSFYNLDRVKKEIEYKNFNRSMQLTILKSFEDKNKLLWLNIYKYDSLQRRVRLDNKR
jgi:DNA polymerase III delta prime subunit